MQLHIGVPKAIARALQQWGSSSDEVCFILMLFPLSLRAPETPRHLALPVNANAGGASLFADVVDFDCLHS